MAKKRKKKQPRKRKLIAKKYVAKKRVAKKKKPRIIRPTFLVYEVSFGWRWILQSNNGKEYAKSTRSYTTKRGCIKSIDAIKNIASKSKIEVLGFN